MYRIDSDIVLCAELTPKYKHSSILVLLLEQVRTWAGRSPPARRGDTSAIFGTQIWPPKKILTKRDRVYTVDMVFTVDMVYTVNIVLAVDMVYTVDIGEEGMRGLRGLREINY